MIHLEIQEIPELGTGSRLISITFLDSLYYISNPNPIEFTINIVSIEELWKEMKDRNLGPAEIPCYLKIVLHLMKKTY